MRHNIETTAKEAIFIFFIELVSRYCLNFDLHTRNKIASWIPKICQLDVYSMRTHLLLLYEMLKRGQLFPPFDKTPSTTSLPSFNPDADNMLLEKLMRQFIEGLNLNNKKHTGTEMTSYEELNNEYNDRDTISRIDSRTSRNRIPKKLVPNTLKSTTQQNTFMIPERHAWSNNCIHGNHQCPFTRRSKSESRMYYYLPVSDCIKEINRYARCICREGTIKGGLMNLNSNDVALFPSTSKDTNSAMDLFFTPTEHERLSSAVKQPNSKPRRKSIKIDINTGNSQNTDRFPRTSRKSAVKRKVVNPSVNHKRKNNSNRIRSINNSNQKTVATNRCCPKGFSFNDLNIG